MNLIKWIAALSLAALVVGCDKPEAKPQRSDANAGEQTFDTRGVVRSVPEGGRTLVVRHEEIPNYMPTRTMELNVRDTNEIAGLERDDEITFQLVATKDTHWIQNIKRIGRVIETNAPVVTSPGRQLTKEL